MGFTDGTLLGGRVRYRQSLDGYRTGIEPVLLAAAVPAQPGQRVLEAGCGAGAGLLCLLARVPGVIATGIEREPAAAALARVNLADNLWHATVLEADVATAQGPVDHAFANPPWHDPAGTRPTDPARARALHRGHAGLRGWVLPLAAALVPDGTLTLVLPAALVGQARTLLPDAGLGDVAVCPLWPRPGRQAKILLVQARRGAAARTAPGLVLHGEHGYTAEADAVLRHGHRLEI